MASVSVVHTLVCKNACAHTSVEQREKAGTLQHVAKVLERNVGCAYACSCFVFVCVSVCARVLCLSVGVVQVWLTLAPDIQTCGNKQQRWQEARCNSTNF